MSSARFTAALTETTAPPTEVVLNPLAVLQPNSATLLAGGLTTSPGRSDPPRRELLWIFDLTGVQIGVIT